MSTSSYPTGASSSGQLCTVAVSPVVDTYICSTQQVVWTSIVPSAPYGVTTTTSNITWRAPITPENYGFPTITSYTLSYEPIWQLASPAITTEPVKFYGVAMSSNGKYQVAKQISYSLTQTCKTYISSNYGQSWSQVLDIPAIVGQTGKGIAVSGTGQYITTGHYDVMNVTTTNMVLYTSSNYGVAGSWKPTTYTTGQTRMEIVSTCMSADGKYQYFVNDKNIFGSSSNYGESWSTQFLNTNVNTAYGSVATDAQGVYVMVGGPNGVRWSPNRGAPGSWRTPLGTFLGRVYASGVAISSNGRYGIITTAVDNRVVYISSNVNNPDTGYIRWIQVPIEKINRTYDFAACAISETGQIQVVGNVIGDIFYSYDYGSNTHSDRILFFICYIIHAMLFMKNILPCNICLSLSVF